MSSSATISPATGAPKNPPKPGVNPAYLVVVCTLFAAAAQVLLKFGAVHPLPPAKLSDFSTLVALAAALLTNWPLMIGYSLHACNALLLIFALREGHLSLMMPIYALSYIWVDLLSIYFFDEHLNLWKSAGIALIIGGVAVLGRESTP